MLDNSRRTVLEGVHVDRADDNLILSVIDEELGHIRKVIGNEDTIAVLNQVYSRAKRYQESLLT
jgi:hypothetical protein